MKTIRTFAAGIVLACLMAHLPVADAQTANVIQDGFTGATAQLPWQAFNGACLTAGTQGMPATGATGIPACYLNTYYGTQVQTGLTTNNGNPNTDPAGSGALRLTNGCAPVSTTKNGTTTTTNTCYYDQNGAIIDTQSYPSNNGIQVTFTTYTYGGDNSGGHGADGIGFYLLDATKATPNIGAWGGSLGYSCSNTNTPYNGMANAYMGLGMDEFGNFLNNSDNTASGDQATSSNGGNGQEYQPGRIGLRAYGNINLASLQAVNPSATASDVQATCKNGGSYSYSGATTYSYAYTYQASGYYTNQVTTSVTYSAPTGSNNSQKNACNPSQNSSLNPTSTTAGGAGTPTGAPLNYSGTLYQQSNSTSSAKAVKGTTTVTYNRTAYTCNTSTVVTTTAYSYSGTTPASATVSTPTTTNNDGWNGTGTIFGLGSDGNYYPITETTTSNTPTLTQTFPDYVAIPGAFVNLPSSTPIANETATSRAGTSTKAGATPISYKLQITSDNKLSLWYSWNGGTYNPVLTNQLITASNAAQPASYLFGFGGSTGGSDNVHEITCFQVTPADVSASSAGLNVQQSGEVRTGTQVYLAYYHPNNWWGELDAQNLVFNATTGIVSIASIANWDASCVLTGGACTATGATSGTAQTPRTLLTWDGVDGNGAVNFSNTGGFSATSDTAAFKTLGTIEQGWLNDDNAGANRLAFLSGDRSNEVPTGTATATQIFRNRNSLLGDIINSSPTWVGPPSSPYPATWKDLLHPTDTVPENGTGAQTYPTFAGGGSTGMATRLNVVYDGSNDGFMHGFETGSYAADGITYNSTGNDGIELVAYMPQAILQTIHNKATPTLDYSSPQYSHNYYVDATPGSGDLFYGSAWHTWLVSGLGAGGNAIFALDITNPSTTSFSASSVIGEWNAAALNTLCGTGSTCGNNLGQTFGTPQIRRLHNGLWGIIFGNGLNSTAGHAGIYVMTISANGVPSTVYFLDTGVGSSSNPDGIAYVTPADLDGDHITDYVYAGDVYGNVWRFDLTSDTASGWAVSTYGQTGATPLFTTPSATTCTVTTSPCPAASKVTTNQPITTAVVALSVAPTAIGQPRVMIEFGTGSVTPQSTVSSIQYSPGQQTLYGIWDWYMGQSGTAGSSYAGLIGSPSAPTKTAPISLSTLQVQTVTSTSTTSTGQGVETVSNTTLCFAGTTCANGTSTPTTGTDFGWYMNLPNFAGVTGVNGGSGVTGNNQTEQVVYSPIETDGAFIVNTTVPANNTPLTCNVAGAQGWTMALNPGTGGAFQSSFFSTGTGFPNVNGQPVSGIAINATGSPSVVTANGHPYLVNQTTTGAGTVNQINPPGGSLGGRLTWLELH
jgi:type IV pilus assembly protein PilY1